MTNITVLSTDNIMFQNVTNICFQIYRRWIIVLIQVWNANDSEKN